MVGASSDRDKINAFLSGLGELPVSDATNVKTGDSVPATPPSFIVDDPDAASGKVQYNCTTTPYSMATNPDKIVTLNPDVGKLWLGSLLQGSGYAGGLGSLKAFPIGHRAPLKVYLDLLNPSVSRTVNNPDAASMQEAIGSLATDAQNKGVDIPNNAAFQQTKASTIKQGLLSLGFSAKYLGAKASGNLETSNDSRTSTVMAALQQRYFTSSFVTPPTPADYFTSDATISDFREQADLGRVGVGNPPVVVSNISYGRTFLMTFESQTTEDKLSAAVGAEFSAATAGAKVEMTAEQKSIMENAKFDLIALGGNEKDFFQAVKSHSIDSFLDNPSKITEARPISYQVDNISEGSAAAFTETAKYNLTTCAAQAGHQETVGSIVKLTNLSVYPERCNQNVYGTVLINGFQVVNIPNADPFLKLREHVPQGLTTSGMGSAGTVQWPQFSPPDPSRYGLPTDLFANNDGFYLAVFNNPDYGPTSAAFNINAGLNNAIFPWRDDTSNTYAATESSPFALGWKTLPGNSAHCPLNLSYEIQKVTDLKVDVP
jgi:Thiol-activated cytolysin